MDAGPAEPPLPHGQAALDALFGACPESVALLDAEGRVLYANPVAVQAFGLGDWAAHRPDPLDGWEILREDGTALQRADLPDRRVFRGERAPEEILRLRRPERGEERWVLARASPVLTEGAARAALSVFRDVTIQRRERARHDLVGRASELLWQGHEPPAMAAALTRLLAGSWADACALDLREGDGWRRAGVAHRQERRLSLPAEGDTLLAEWSVDPRPLLVEAQDRPASLLFSLRTSSILIVPMRARGELMGRLIIARDIEASGSFTADDMPAMGELAQRCATAFHSARVLRESETTRTRLRDILDGVDAVVWESEVETGRFTLVSRRAKNILGLSPRLWMEQPTYWRDHVHPADRDEVLRVRQQRTQAGEDHDMEYRMAREDGRVVWVRDLVYVLRDPEGRPSRLRGILVDVTAAKRAERRLALQSTVSRLSAECGSLAELAPRLLPALAEHLELDVGLVWTPRGGAAVEVFDAWAPGYVGAKAFFDISRSSPLAHGEGLPGRAWAEGRGVWARDISTGGSPRAEAAAACGLRGAVAFPIRLGARTYALVELFARDMWEPDAELLTLLEQLGQQLALFVERVEAEENVRRSNALRGAIVEASLDCIITIDEAGRVLEWNPAAERTFGYSADEALGREMADLIIPPELRDAHREGVRRLHDSGQARILEQRREVPAMRKDGSVFDAELAIVRLPGEPARFTGFVRDVTQPKRAERALRESEHRYAQILDSVQDMVVCKDRDGRVLYVNKAACQHHGMSRERLLGSVDGGSSDPDQVAARLDADRRVFETGQPVEVPEEPDRRHDGQVRIFHTLRTPIFDTEGRVTQLVGVSRDVTERARGEDELRLREARFRSLVDAASQTVWVATPAGEMRDDSPSWRRFTGQTRQQMSGRGWLDAVHPDDRKATRKSWSAAVAAGAAWEMRHRIRRADGAWAHALSRAVPVRNAERAIREYVGMSVDVSDQLHVEQALRESEARYRTLVQASAQIVWSADARGHARDMAEWRAHTGQTEEEASERGWLQAIHPDDLAWATQAWERAIREGEPLEMEVRLRGRDGEHRHFALRAVPLREEGQGIREWVGTCTDVTDRRRAERAVRDSEARYRFLAEAIPQQVWTSGPGGALDYVNRRCVESFGIPQEAILRDGWTSHVHPDERDAHARAWAQSLAEGVPFEREVRLRDARGEYRWHIARALPLKDAAGRVLKWFGTQTDIHGQKETAEAAKRLLVEVETQRRRLDTIVASVPGVVWEAWGEPDALHQRIDFVSEHVERMLGYTTREWTSTPNFWLTIVHPEDREHAARESSAIFTSGRSGEMRFRWVTKDGAVLWVQAHAVAILDEQGKPVGMRGVTLDVSERHRAELAARASEERFQLLARATNDTIWDWDLVRNAIWWNENLEATFGWRPHEVEPGAESWMSRIHPEERDRVEASLRAILASESLAWAQEYRFRRHDGAYAYVYDRGVIVRDAEGRARRVIGSMMDMSARKRAEAALRESEERFRFLADTVPGQVWTARPDGGLDYVNSRMLEYFGRDAEALVGEGWRDFVHPDDLPEAASHWTHSLETGAPFQVEFRLRDAEGGHRWHIGRALPLRDAGGRIVKWFGANTDIQEQKRAAEELALLAKELQDQVALTNTITDNAASALFMVDRAGYPVFANPAALAMTGYANLDEIKDRPLHDTVHFLKPDGSPYPIEECPMELANAEAQPLRDQREFLCRRDGTRFPVEYNLAPVLKHGRPQGALIEVRDITARRAAEEQLKRRARELAELAAALERSNRELDQFAYVTSHDLKAPLRGIANLSRWIEEDLGRELPEEVTAHFELLRGRVQRMENLIDAILEYSRAARVRVKPEPVHVPQLVREIVDLLAPPPGFRVEIPAEAPGLVTERTRLQQVLLNLVGNALKHHPRKHEGVVSVRCAPAEPGFVRFEVADDGAGIPARFHEKIFVIFQTLEARDKVEGTGIGLALVKKIVESKGGNIRVESEPGGGSTFIFTWPSHETGET